MELCLHSPYTASFHGHGQPYFYKFENKNSTRFVVKFPNKNVYEEQPGGCRYVIRVGTGGRGDVIWRSQGLGTLSKGADFMTVVT